jgi:hypothetical protein
MYAEGAGVDPKEQRRVLDEVLGSARAHAGRGVVVFDLDSTLFDNRPRQARILREYGEARGLAALSGTRPEHFNGWSLADAMANAGLDAGAVEAHRGPAKGFWKERFFTSEYCVDDVPLDGAVDYVRAVLEAGAQVAYVTGRHTPMGPGTVECFRRHGFALPEGERVHLLLKPAFETTDDDWKVEAYARIDRLGPVAAAFDNEPAHINGYAARYIGALCVRLATDDSGRPIRLAPGIPSIADFRRG